MTIIGLTGGIASGKSTASERLKELGGLVVDADRLGHRVYDPGTPGFEKIVNAFGHDLVAEDGSIDRRILGGKVFGAPDEMKRLTDIAWPEIRRMAGEEFAKLREQDPDAVIVFEAAVLLEAEWQDLVDEVWVVTTKVETAIDRLKSRNGLAREAALARIDSQMTNKQRLEFADVKIDNSEDEDKLRSRIEYHWKRLLKRIAEPAS
jgi:dephospho-CoA kinase